jgi:hypothetical protein
VCCLGAFAGIGRVGELASCQLVGFGLDVQVLVLVVGVLHQDWPATTTFGKDTWGYGCLWSTGRARAREDRLG